ncbi:MgtC/SapB family protein [Nereida sp. MMG025]|uniref:MgtC/SapB family protein n=1 Tax=Nereida sp. MMG025 TaxID=2909981 RepID=UPI001F2361D1|nr:MgtC/SapB family protein [Nereida sp. MMG025]MCF6445843.1 MgtC/SapB family protein [Nereida sp. MMG025]
MIDLWEFGLRASVAVILGFLIGFERESKSKPLGIRAYMLVCLGSAGLMMITMNYALSISQTSGLSADPTRLIQGLVGGIGFLGAGAIISNQSDGRLRGVGSGAAIWGVGGIGIACGLGFLAEAGILAVLTFVILTGCDRLQSEGQLPDGQKDDASKDEDGN